MTRAKRIRVLTQRIRKIVADYRRLSKAFDAAKSAGTMDIDGALSVAIWAAFDTLLGEIDASGWIRWFVFDNDCGKRKRAVKASYRHPYRNICTARQMAEVMVDHEDS